MDRTNPSSRKNVRRWRVTCRSIALAVGLSAACSTMTPPKKVTYEGREIPLHSYMQETFVRTEVIQRALIAGDLDRVRVEARWIVDRPQAKGIPSGWDPFVARMKTAATTIAQATTTRSMGHGVGSLGAVCGDCHSSLNVTVAFPSVPAPAKSGDLRQRMRRHQWGTDRFWDALVTSDNEVWVSGAEVFERNGGDLTDGTPGDPHLLDQEVPLRRLGAEARRAPDSPTRIELYAKVVSACATCHHTARRSP